jgi:hypothetical protein
VTLSEARRRRPRRRRRRFRWLLLPLALVVAFLAGIGLGEALHDNPKTGGTQTLVRTLHPLPLVPVAQNTVTVTTSRP